MSEIPKLDERDFSDLMNEVKRLAKQYIPEWNFDENSEDLGIVFAKVFCNMMEDTLSRYNKTLYNYYLTFLNMLGTKLRPATSASGMIIVKSSGSSKGVYIDQGTRLFAPADNEDGMVIYETLDALTAIDTTLKAVYFTDGIKDVISCVYENVKLEKEKEIIPFRIFDNMFCKNLQSHEMYFWDDIVFNMSNTDVIFSFYNNLSAIGQNSLPAIFSDPDNVTWEYYDGKKWKSVDSVQKTELGVKIKFKGSSIPTKVLDKESRFLRCRFKIVPEGDIRVTSIKYQSVSDYIPADSFFADDTQLAENDFYPFDEEYTMYNRFSVASDEAFTKKGAIIELSAGVQFVKINTNMKIPGKKYKSIMSDIDFADLEPGDIKIEKVKWEYWNGSGWARLETFENGEEFFTLKEEKISERVLKFKCPEDIQSVSVGSANGYFIRSRITKMSDRFDFYANFITPYVHDFKVKYNYEGSEHQFDNVIVKSDLESNFINLSDKGLSVLMERRICKSPAMYMCLSKPLVQGMIRILINIEEGIHRFNPTLKWEYLARNHKGEAQWKHIEVMDATDNFSHTETVTMIGKNDFVESTIFGVTGYFVRIVNQDNTYSYNADISNRPVINDIKFNSIRAMQKDTRPPEYFWIEKDEEDKHCKLSHSNIANVEVWIDEFGKISTSEQEMFLKCSVDKVNPEYDELGRLEKLWIKWKKVSNLISYGVNDRVYEVDYSKGEIIFGNGRNGKIPPEQYNESIKIEYSVCNGSKGNIGIKEIKDFVNTIPHIDGVYNLSPMLGGVDMESIDSAARRVFGQISGGNRLVSLSDFEDSIRFHDRNIYRVKCLSHFDEDSNPCIGVTSIAILPRVYMQGYEKFQGIKNKVWKFIDEKSPASLSQSSRLRIFEVGYVETSISVDIVIDDFNSYQGVYSGIETRLKKFLDPVRGNFSGEGWEIGKFPRKEFIYNYIKIVPGIKWIKNINIFTKLITPEGKKEVDFENIGKYKFVVPIFGVPEINITVG